MIVPSLMRRMALEPSPRLVLKFAWNFGFKSMLAMRRYQRRLKRGVHFPPFLYLSVTNACNLRCKGCWVSVDGVGNTGRQFMDKATFDAAVGAAKRRGSCFFGILGGEPFLHPGLLDLLGAHRDCYFQLFTNGHALSDANARALARLGNVTPLISIEGSALVSDLRRGRLGVFDKSMAGIDAATRHRLITGVATSVCRNNIDDLLTESWLRELIRRRVQYVWFYIYRPVGPNPGPELALSPEQITRVRRFIVEMRARLPIGIVDAYWDGDGRAVCPMAMGLSHHVNPWGDVEPCPVLQFARESFAGGAEAAVEPSAFLETFRRESAARTRGCILMEDPALVLRLVAQTGARDTSGRMSAAAELAKMTPVPSHHLSGQEIPERHWLYRWLKKHYFFGFGAYG